MTKFSDPYTGRTYNLDQIVDWIEDRMAEGNLPGRLMYLPEWGGKAHDENSYYVQRGYRKVGDPVYFLSFDVELAAWRHLASRQKAGA